MKEDKPLVSVIMNCYNGEKYLKSAINSVYSQTYTNWEIIFFDNASTDNTAEIANSFDNKLRYFCNETTVPLGAARNLALKQSVGEFIAFLDVDDFWLPDKLTKQLPLFYNRDKIGLVFSDTIQRLQEAGRETTYFVEHKYVPPRGKIFSSLLRHYSIPMLTVVIKKEVLDLLDEWFDESFQVCDDYDFFLRIAYKWECDYIDEPLANALIHNEALTVTKHHRAAIEKTIALDKLIKKDSSFIVKYSDDLDVLYKQIAYLQGKSLWRNKESVKARIEFMKYLGNVKFFMTYCATFFPYSWVAFFLNKVR